MQTLRKKTSPLKYKNETSRFLGEGVSFKAKLIGILEVSEARGDRMCQEALSDLKVAIRAAGEHKQRITINIAIDGLRLRDEKNGDCLYHHPVHKISFIAQDMTDSRAFGYIFGSPDTGHRFFGIKTDKAASQVVIAMRDLFQVVFALKKKEIELAKQSLDKSHYVCSLFTENSSPSKATSSQDSKKSTEKRSIATEAKSNLAVADLVDLELELNSLQQGLTQMERITPSDPFGSKDDPFGDSFTQYKHPILLPPPPGKEKSTRHSESVTSRTSIGTPTSQEKTNSVDFDQSIDWPKVSVNSSLDVFEEVTPSPPPLQPKATDEKRHEILKQEILSQFHVFTELDPLGTGKSKPYVDKKHFFQELKNPPKTVLNDLVGASKDTEKASLCQDPFGEDPFKEDPFSESQFMKDPFNTDDIDVKLDNKSSLVMNFGGDSNSFLRNILKSEPQSNNNNNNNSSGIFSRQNTFDVDFSKLDEEQPSGKSISFDMPTATESTQIVPPPLPPKRQMGSHFNKPPPRPPPEVLGDYSNASYDSSDIYKSPAELREVKIAVTPVDLESEKIKVGLSPPAANPMTTSLQNLNNAFKQLTLSNLTELAEKLNIPSSKLNNMTLAQLADYLTAVTNEKRQNSSEDVSFKADFASNFVEKGNEDGDNYDKYAVFRDILQEELDQKVESKSEVNVNVEKDVIENKSEDDDRYAALRNITPEIASNGKKEDEEEEKTSNMFDSKEAKELFKIEPPPVKDQPIKSPQGPSLTVTIKNNKSFTSGSLSDAASGSSPENTNFSEQDKTNNDFAGSWAIFDSPKVHSDENKEKVGIQSEEGASPWSSDSKEFGIGTPPEWKQSIDSSNGEEHLSKKHRRRKYGDKWGNFDEPQSQYYPTRRNQSEDPRYYYERHHRFHHTKCPRPIDHSVDHSSSSRDVSPEEAADEDMRIPINHRDGGKQVRCRSGKYPFEKHWCRKYTDSWDEEDDYEYEEEESKPCNWKEHAHYTRDLDRSSSVEQDKSWTKNWPEQRKFRRRCESEEGSKKCCVDWRLETEGKHGPHYGSARFPPSESGRRRYEKKHEPEPNWEEYRYNSGSIYGTHKRNWKRPSSTSELEQKIHTLRPKTGGSDGERERRFKNTRRSRSRDSQYSEKYKQSAPVPPTVTSKRPSFQKPEKFDLPPVSQERPQSGSFRRNKRDEPIIEAKREKEEFPKRSPSVETRTVEINKGQGFEDDFTLDKIAKTPEREGIGVIREESVTDEFPEDAREVGRLMAVHKKNRNRARMGNTLKFDVNNLKKSESVNIFEQENDPFDDDFFSENADIFMTNDQDQEWSKFDDT